jgi:hypothetical protein
VPFADLEAHVTTPVRDPNRQTQLSSSTTSPAWHAVPVRPPSTSTDTLPNVWSRSRRVGFRFAFAYLLLYNFPFPLGAVPFTDTIKEWYDKLWHLVVPWFAAHVLHLAKPITIFSNGSGDTTYDYVLALVTAGIAAVVALLWSIADRRSLGYPRLEAGLRVYIRYVLAYALLSYGAFKVIQTQFPYPPLDKLVEPFGEFSPMGVVWAWMGMSYAYNLFAGLAEMMSGFLLFFRRTTMLGSLLAIAVMSNVVIINFAFDVPVKLYSSHLLLMAILLVAPDAGRLVNACVLNRGMSPNASEIAQRSRRIGIGRMLLKTLLILIGVGYPLWTSFKFSRQIAPPLYGIWEVDSFVRGRDAIPALVGDSIRWRRMVVSFPGSLSMRLLNDSTRGYRVKADTVQHTLLLTSRRDSLAKFPFHYARSGTHNDRLQLDGVLNGDSLHVMLHRTDESKFLLVSRGYHWINEFPLNR